MRLRYYYKAILFGLFAALAAFCIRVVADDAAGAAPATLRDGETGVLLLQDGGVLVGQITRAADWYVVARGGGQMQIATSRVQFVGHTLHEAYEHRLRHTTRPTAESHLALSEWCLRYGLVDEAAAEAATAKSLGAGQGRLQLIGRRIAAAKLRLDDKSAVTPAVHAAVAEQATPLPSASRDLPNGALELFTRKVQPILVNNCTASKCHQPGGQQAFQLNRALLRGEANRQTTTQNLYATLALVDRARPEASPLLTVPRRTHGGLNGPIFGARQEKSLRYLADWVSLVAPVKPADAIAPKVPVESSDATQDGENSAVQPAVAIENAPVESLRTPHRLRYGETPKPWQPRDPFDPEIFNRRQRAQVER